MKYSCLVMFGLLWLWGCTKKVNEPISKSLGKPMQVTEVKVENMAGGALISYRIPNQEDIISVKATYTLETGKKMEAVASIYENKINISGFNDEKPHEVLLYTVNRAQETSEPVSCTVQPLESPLSLVSKTMFIQGDFGGARYSWSNNLKSPLTFEFFTLDSLGRMALVRIINSQLAEGAQSLRGYKPLPRPFGVVVKDNFGNRSDTIFPTGRLITPLYEEKLAKSRMRIMRLGNDQNFTNFEGSDQKMIDDDRTSFGHSPSSSLPAPFTIDLGVVAKVSRLVIFQRLFSNSYYNWGNPKAFDLYVRTSAPSQSGDWQEWTKIMDTEIIKPSGGASGTVTDDDLRAAEAGHEFTFNLSQEPVRYIRIVVKSTWGSTTFTHPAEIDVFGEPK